ncbi:MAG: retron system putative HNH endonuclease [Minicystis sp.]
MRRIEKGAEPACLADLRSTPGADWSSVSGDQRNEMRARLFAEQHGLCAYCMSRIPHPPSKKGMKIEHFEARANRDEKTFLWSNLLGVCLGDVGIVESASGDRGARFHCDTYRGNVPLDVHPAAFPPDVGACFSYSLAGEIRPASTLDATMHAEVSKTITHLNLNIDRLKRNRRAVIERLRADFTRKAPKTARVQALLEQASRPDGEGLLPPYAQVAVRYLAKKLRQLEGPG